MTRILLFALFILLVISCDRDAPRVYYEDGLVEIADYIRENKDKYSRFHDIMIKGELTDQLDAYNPSGSGFTLFMPTDDAFDRYILKNDKYSSFEEFLKNADLVRVLGLYHVVTGSLRTNEFPYGSLPDTTATGDLLTVGFSTSLDTTLYKINNVAPVIEANLEMLNGYIHVISEVLEPVIYTGYQWLENKEGFSILAEALEITGIKDTLGQYRYSTNNRLVKNQYTLLAEHDSIFQRYEINSVDDLINKFSSTGNDLTDIKDSLYQFVAYHILEGSYFLVDFVNANYNTFGYYPVSFNTGIDIKINLDLDTFAIEISPGGDTTYLTHIGLYHQESNILTKTGAVHLLNDMMVPYRPPKSTRTFQFYEEPEINNVRNKTGSFEFTNQEELEVLSWTGPESIIYRRYSSSSSLTNNDYLLIEGDFTITYNIPKILPGRYRMYIRTGANNNIYPTVQVFLDGKRIGSNLDLTAGKVHYEEGGASSSIARKDPYDSFKCGTIELTDYEGHTVTVYSLVPGRLLFDYVQFVPE